MDWKDLVAIIESGRLDSLDRLQHIKRIYNSRQRRIPSDGLHVNDYPYHVGKGIYNYVLFGDNIKFRFPEHVKVISYVNKSAWHFRRQAMLANSPNRRSMPEKYHINIFITSDYVPNGYLYDMPPYIEFVENIIWYGHKQYPPFHPTVYLYYTYLLSGGDRYYSDFLMLVDPWYRDLE